jgi:DNA polymerase II small subunit
MLAKDIDMELDIHFDITGQSVTEGRMEDILSCFNDRLKTIKRFLIQGGLPARPISISELVSSNRHRDGSATIIGLVDDPKHTKNGHLLFSLEDETASVRCLCRLTESAGKNHPVNAGLMPDDAIGVTGRFAREGDLLIVDNIHFPPMARHTKSRAGADASVSAAFLSDIHLGSRTFLRPQWQKLVEWFHNDPIAQTVKYFVLSGDGVDGIGIYPGQEKELMITDLFDQYSELAKLLEVLPDHLEVLLLPGNHDAVRPAEPQPALDPEVQTDYNNTTFVGNPCDFSLHGVRILSYHGKSIDDFVAQMRSVSYAKPETAMRAMLERRHLAPSWGGKTPLSPEPEDRLVIPVVPDIFVTGHVHGHFVGEHKGVTMVHSSTWQDQTSYQRMLGFQPKPCMLTVINLNTHASTTIPFA